MFVVAYLQKKKHCIFIFPNYFVGCEVNLSIQPRNEVNHWLTYVTSGVCVSVSAYQRLWRRIGSSLGNSPHMREISSSSHMSSSGGCFVLIRALLSFASIVSRSACVEGQWSRMCVSFPTCVFVQ